MESKEKVVDQERTKDWTRHLTWLGLLVTFAGVISYFLYFVQFPDLRDFPVVNLPVMIIGLVLTGTGCRQVFKQKTHWLGKSLALLSMILAFGFSGLFVFYVFDYSYRLPESTDAPGVGIAAPDFTLPDAESKPVSLADYRGLKVVMVFYRGHW